MNLRTDLNTNLVFTNNRVLFNGTSAMLDAGDGVYIRVGTDSYLAADVRDNVFSGNLVNDLHIESFVAYNRQTNAAISPPPASTSVAAPALDSVFLDDTAQLDFRLTGNTGNSVNIVDPSNNSSGTLAGNVTPNGAFYPDDPLKRNFGPNFPHTRLTQLFQLDDGSNVNAPANTFVSNGVTQNLQFEFLFAQWHLRSSADPIFPNPAFPEDFFTDPGDPFLP
ncbi:MAG: hypothetical protein FJ267_17330 [Planctomycetes bacterium]|nr:hypothetical protein [Planctomycetota bacterium]